MNTRSTDNVELSDRARQLLKALIETHIAEGQPVGSRTLAKTSQLRVSAATIRNIMADLEDLGLITSPHTSAGRVPTEAGYRFFIDSLLETRPLNEETIASLESGLRNVSDPHAAVEAASRLLSGITQLAGIVTLPRRTSARLAHIEFIKLDSRRVLAVVVLGYGEVQNRVLVLERDFTRKELQRAARYLNEHFAGLGFGEARERLLKELDQLRTDLNNRMAAVVELGQEALSDEEEEDYVLAGETNLMDYQELLDVDKLRSLFEVFNRKRDILHILDRCANAQGVQIFIGHESGNEILGDCSVVTAPYAVEGKVMGVLGVIGPTRMAYDRVIPIVDVTARLLGAALNSH